MKEKEIWKPIISLPPYLISNKGRLKGLKKDSKGSKDSTENLALKRGRKGYLVYDFMVSEKNSHECEFKRFRIDILVLEAFCLEPKTEKNQFVIHLDGDLENSCIENLKWGTEDELLEYNGLIPSDLLATKLTEDEVLDILAARGTYREIGERFDVSGQTVYNIQNGLSWKKLTRGKIGGRS